MTKAIEHTKLKREAYKKAYAAKLPCTCCGNAIPEAPAYTQGKDRVDGDLTGTPRFPAVMNLFRDAEGFRVDPICTSCEEDLIQNKKTHYKCSKCQSIINISSEELVAVVKVNVFGNAQLRERRICGLCYDNTKEEERVEKPRYAPKLKKTGYIDYGEHKTEAEPAEQPKQPRRGGIALSEPSSITNSDLLDAINNSNAALISKFDELIAILSRK